MKMQSMNIPQNEALNTLRKTLLAGVASAPTTKVDAAYFEC
jgi:hypothetical protein